MTVAKIIIKREAASDEIFDPALTRMIDNFFSGKQPLYCPTDHAWSPPTDVFETANAIHIKMELAGVKEEEMEVKVNDNFLMIRGQRTDERHTRKENFHMMEIHYGSFERVFGLPARMRIANITAELKDGFLMVTIPKDETIREIHIEIN